MGIRRLRARLDQLQSKANWTMDDARTAIADAAALLDDIRDGVGFKLLIDEHAASKLLAAAKHGGEVPITIALDPEYDTLPSEVCQFKGGPYDGKRYKITHTEDTTITLAGGHRYLWDGRVFRYQGGRANAERRSDDEA